MSMFGHVAVGIALLATLVGCSKGVTEIRTGDSAKGGFSPYVDSDGNIRLPSDFRKNMVHLGRSLIRDTSVRMVFIFVLAHKAL
jgi:hypothetical protein